MTVPKDASLCSSKFVPATEPAWLPISSHNALVIGFPKEGGGGTRADVGKYRNFATNF